MGPHVPTLQDEHQAVEEYIQEALQQLYIQPSTSPVSAGFFFVQKKGGVFNHALIIGVSTR